MQLAIEKSIFSHQHEGNMPETEVAVCRRCHEAVGSGTGFAMCEDRNECYSLTGRSGCHEHYGCYNCTHRTRRHGGPLARVSHCERDPERRRCESCESCEQTCECIHCEACGSVVSEDDGTCAECNRCQQCCSCSRCGRCGDRASDTLCPDCDHCETCCDCASDDCVPRVRADGIKFHAAGRKEHKENPSKRYIAVELEVCGVKSNGREIAAAVRKWNGAIVDDGSLPGGGFEINTAPASGDFYTRQIDEICAELAKGQAWADTDAGMHVHVDARDFSYYDMRKLVKLYAHIENQLYRTCRVWRRDTDGPGHYCAPCGETYSKSLRTALVPKASKEALLKNVYGRKPDKNFVNTKREKYCNVRYHALNLHSWVYRGTVECRMYHGTVKPKGAKAWGMLWAGILDFAYKHGEGEIDSLVRKETPHDLLMACAPTDAVRTWLQSRWNSLHKEHAGYETREDKRRANERRVYEDSCNAERRMEAMRMQRAEQACGARPPWAVGVSASRGEYSFVYTWLGPDDVYLAELGVPNTGDAAAAA